MPKRKDQLHPVSDRADSCNKVSSQSHMEVAGHAVASLAFVALLASRRRIMARQKLGRILLESVRCGRVDGGKMTAAQSPVLGD